MAPQKRSLNETIELLEKGQPPGAHAGFLGANLDPQEASLLLLPVPWEATTSYGGGTSRAPEAIIRASHQLDLEDSSFNRPYRAGITFIDADPLVVELNAPAKGAAALVIEAIEEGRRLPEALARVNQASIEVTESVYRNAKSHLEEGKFIAVVGGDHACPEGLIRALAEASTEPFGILHFDAHHDLRAAYEGFIGSHASIFYNVMEKIPAVNKLVQVGIRDYSRDERRYAEDLGERASVFYGNRLFAMKADGVRFRDITEQIINELPQRVYISFDIDALDPPYCPSTGTPVPGGLSFDEACYMLEQLARSGRKVIGFDLCEVTPGEGGDEWDANVGARLLYKLCGALLHSQGLCELNQ